MHTGGGGAPHVPPIKILKNFYIKQKNDPTLIFSQPQVPPSKEFAKKPQGHPPPLDFSNYCASMEMLFDVVVTLLAWLKLVYLALGRKEWKFKFDVAATLQSSDN
jgi:hypothetical protein